MNKRVQRSAITFILSIVAMIAMVLLGGKTTAQEAGGSELSLDNVTVTSFKITDVTNGNREIEYKKQSDAQYEEYKNDPSRFSNALNEGQIDMQIKLDLSVSYSAQEALKEGDTLVIPATIDGDRKDFASKPFFDGENHELGTWEYKNGNVVIHFSGDYIKNNKVTKFTASFETGLIKLYLTSRPKTTKLGERLADPGTIGKEKFVVGREKMYIVAEKLPDTRSFITKVVSAANDSTVSWQINLVSDYITKTINGSSKPFFSPHMLQNNGEYSPKALTDIYIEDTLTDVVEKPTDIVSYVWISGIDDDGNVISGDYATRYVPANLKRIEQGNRSKEEVKNSLNKGEYTFYDNHDGSYTLMLKWWDMNDPNGIKYDDVPAVKQAGGAGNFLKAKAPEVFGQLKPETIEKINTLYSGKSIQNAFFIFNAKYATVSEKTEVPNTATVQTKQYGIEEKKRIAVLTPTSGVADAPADPLSIKLLKTDVKTGGHLSEGFKFELQSSDDNGTTWNKVELNQGMIVKGNLNTDNTVTPNEEGAVEVNSLVNGTNYRFVEKAHADGYKDVTEDNANPNTAKNPTAANSRVVKVSVQDSGKVVVMYNEKKPETVSVEGTKTWDDADNQDGKRPSQITVNLLKNGQKVASKTVTEADGWKWTFDNLDKYENDAEITYTVEEETVEGYTATVNGYNITNTHTPGKTSVQVTKKWDDADNQDGKRPSSVTFVLYADGQKTDKTLVVSQENNWTGSFAELDEYKAGKQIEYTVKESGVENGYIASIFGNNKNGFVVTNTRATEKTTVEGAKTWDDADNQDGKRPEEITINLLKNGEKVASKTVTKADGWKWSFENLAKYENGKEITYSIVEEQVESYSSKVDGYNVTNSYTPGKTSVQVTKKWDDADDKDGKRPTSVTITLYADGEKTDKTLVLNKENNWTGNFTELDEYKAGEKIEYSIKEEPIGNGYVSEISGNVTEGFVVTNTRTPDPEVPVTPTTQTPLDSTTTEDRGKELPNTGTTGSLAVIGFVVLIAAALVLTVKTKKA